MLMCSSRREWYYAAAQHAQYLPDEETRQSDTILEEDENEGEGSEASLGENQSVSPEAKHTEAGRPDPEDQEPRVPKETSPAQKAAWREMRREEILALIACFAGPLLGAYLLHTIRSQLTPRSEGRQIHPRLLAGITLTYVRRPDFKFQSDDFRHGRGNTPYFSHHQAEEGENGAPATRPSSRSQPTISQGKHTRDTEAARRFGDARCRAQQHQRCRETQGQRKRTSKPSAPIGRPQSGGSPVRETTGSSVDANRSALSRVGRSAQGRSFSCCCRGEDRTTAWITLHGCYLDCWFFHILLPKYVDFCHISLKTASSYCCYIRVLVYEARTSGTEMGPRFYYCLSFRVKSTEDTVPER